MSSCLCNYKASRTEPVWRLVGCLRPLLAAEERGDRGERGEQDEQTGLHFEPSFLVPAARCDRLQAGSGWALAPH